ncbi:MAG TPA: ATP synthase F1 subunit delta [Bacteroidales bacterium]|nr:ATP synthase F1 subunit delta [Bacteroidales bacterium]
MKYENISIRYAKALFNLAQELNLVQIVADDMRIIQYVFGFKELNQTINNPIIKQSKKISIVKALLKDKINEISLKYLILVIRRKRENLIYDIANQYINIYREKMGIKLAKFRSAIDINENIKLQVIQVLKNIFASDIELVTIVEPKLIGGFVLSIDGKRYDASIRNKLNRLSKEFKINIYEKIF